MESVFSTSINEIEELLTPVSFENLQDLFNETLNMPYASNDTVNKDVVKVSKTSSKPYSTAEDINLKRKESDRRASTKYRLKKANLIKDLTDKVKNLEKDNDMLEKKIEYLETDKNQLKKEIKYIEDSRNQLKKQLENLEMKVNLLSFSV